MYEVKVFKKWLQKLLLIDLLYAEGPFTYRRPSSH